MQTLDEQLEAAWNYLDQGDLPAARRQAEALQVSAGATPELHTLLGAIIAAEGNTDAAMAAFRQAMELDPDYFEPVLLAAELAAADGALEEALELAEQALDTADEEAEYLEALLFKAELELEIEDIEAATETLSELPPIELNDPRVHVRAGNCLLELEDFDAAERHFQAAIKLDENVADAHYGLGLVASGRDDTSAAIGHFAKVRSLDLAAKPPALQSDFNAMLEHLRPELPQLVNELLNVPFSVSDYPSAEEIESGVDPRQCACFKGRPAPQQGDGPAPKLDSIVLYRRNLERDALAIEEVEGALFSTLLHEASIFFNIET